MEEMEWEDGEEWAWEDDMPTPLHKTWWWDLTCDWDCTTTFLEGNGSPVE